MSRLNGATVCYGTTMNWNNQHSSGRKRNNTLIYSFHPAVFFSRFLERVSSLCQSILLTIEAPICFQWFFFVIQVMPPLSTHKWINSFSSLFSHCILRIRHESNEYLRINAIKLWWNECANVSRHVTLANSVSQPPSDFSSRNSSLRFISSIIKVATNSI